MFLSGLSSSEKSSFLELAHLVASADESIREEEMLMLISYCHEMGLPETVAIAEDRQLEDVLNHFTDRKSRQIVFMEILALIFADGEYQDEERELLKRIKAKFDISDEKYEAYKSWVRTANEVYRKGYELVES